MLTEEVIQLILDNDYSEFNMAASEKASASRYITVRGSDLFSFEVKRDLSMSEMTLTISRRLRRCLIAEEKKISRVIKRLDLLAEKRRITAELEKDDEETQEEN